MKFCSKCGTAAQDDIAFCSKCGTRFATEQTTMPQAAPAQPAPQAAPAQPAPQAAPAQPAPQAASAQPAPQAAPAQPAPQAAPAQPAPHMMSQPMPPQAPKKKMNAGVIVAIVAAGLLVLAAIGFTAEKIFQAQGYGDSSQSDTSVTQNYDDSDVDEEDYEAPAQDDTSVQEEEPDVQEEPEDTIEYTKGAIVGGWYENAWANLRFDTTSGDWIDGTSDMYSSFEGDGKTECGLIVTDASNTKQLAICFEKLDGLNAFVGEDEYLEKVSSGVADSLTEKFASTGYTFSASDIAYTTIAGRTYKTSNISTDGVSMVISLNVAKYDGYMIAIMITEQDESGVSAIANSVRTMN